MACGPRPTKQGHELTSQTSGDEITVIEPTDFLDVAGFAPIQMEGHYLTLKKVLRLEQVGERFNCEFYLPSGEEFELELEDEQLIFHSDLNSPMIYQRVSGEKGSFFGSWERAYEKGSISFKEKLSLLDTTRLFIRLSCEG